MRNERTDDQRLEEIADLFEKVNKSDMLFRFTREAYKDQLESMTKKQIVMHAIQQMETIHQINRHLIDVRGDVTDDLLEEKNNEILNAIQHYPNNDSKLLVEFTKSGVSVQKLKIKEEDNKKDYKEFDEEEDE